MDQRAYFINFDDVSNVDANRYASELRDILLDAAPYIEVELKLDDPHTLGFSIATIFVLALEEYAAAIIAETLGDWLKRRPKAKITIKTANDEVVGTNLTSKDVPKLAELLKVDQPKSVSKSLHDEAQNQAVETLKDVRQQLSSELSSDLINLVVEQAIRYEHTGNLTDLQRIVRAWERAAKQIPSRSSALLVYFSAMTWAACETRYEHTGNLTDLQRVVGAWERAAKQIPSDSYSLPINLNVLATGMIERYRHTKTLNDLEHAIRLYREAVERSWLGSFEQPIFLNNLGRGLFTRYEHTKELTDLEQAIRSLEQAVEIASDSSLLYKTACFNLASCLSLRYEFGRDVADVNRAISLFDQALALNSVYNQSLMLPTLIGSRKSVKHREVATTLFEQGMQRVILGSPSRIDCMINLSSSLTKRYRHFYKNSNNRDDLERAIRLNERVVQEKPILLSSILKHMSSLGNELKEIYVREGNLDDLERAIKIWQEALRLAGPGRPVLPKLISNLGLGLKERYIHTGDLSDLEGVVSLEKQVTDHTSQEDVSKQINDMVREARDLLDFIIQPSYVNVCIVRPADQTIVPKTMGLGAGNRYNLRLDIGPLFDDSIVTNAEQYPFPVEHLPETEAGYWLEVVIVSDDFTVPGYKHHLFLPRFGTSWVCNCTPGEEHKCTQDSRKHYLFIPITAPEKPVIAQLRIAIYYQKNLIQSQLLTAKITREEQVGAGHSSRIDYTLSSNLHDLSSLPPRTLHILTNDNVDGTHRIVINGDKNDPLAFNLTEGQMRGTVNAAREALRNIHFEELGGQLGSRRQRHNRLDKNCRKTRDAFIKDMEELAPLGWQLWTLLMRGQLEWREKLLKPAVIQVSRVIGSTLVFPWALVYDIPLGSHTQYELCPLVENWNGTAPLLDSPLHRCPHENEHKHKNVLCPFGFWGFRHVIEQPPSMPKGRNLPLLIQMANRPPELLMGYSLALNENLTAEHIHVMTEQLSFKVQPSSNLEEIIKRLAYPIEVVYFYCHGGTEALSKTNEQTPYLEVGKNEQFQPTDITTWRVADWPMRHWEDTSPLVFINGCHTAELTPELLVNFVDEFTYAYAAGVIGTEIAVEQEVATEAAQQFFSQFQENGVTVGQALRHMRLHFLSKGNLLGLAYTPYCSANLHI